MTDKKNVIDFTARLSGDTSDADKSQAIIDSLNKLIDVVRNEAGFTEMAVVMYQPSQKSHVKMIQATDMETMAGKLAEVAEDCLDQGPEAA